jgi:hypothetical protein
MNVLERIRFTLPRITIKGNQKPEIYEWGMRRRIFRLYGELKLFEVQLTEHSA